MSSTSPQDGGRGGRPDDDAPVKRRRRPRPRSFYYPPPRNLTARSALFETDWLGVVALPYRLNERGLQAVEELARAGVHRESLAPGIGVDPKTLRAIFERQPEAERAFERGRLRIEAELVGLLIKKARKGDVAAIIFATKNLANFSDHGPRDGGDRSLTVNITVPPAMTPEEFARVAKIEPPTVDVTPESVTVEEGAPCR